MLLNGMLEDPKLQQATEYLLDLWHRPQGTYREMLAVAGHYQEELDSVVEDLLRIKGRLSSDQS